MSEEKKTEVYDMIKSIKTSAEKNSDRIARIQDHLKEMNKQDESFLELINAVHDRVKDLDFNLDTRIKLSVYEKLDIKWASYGIMVTLLGIVFVVFTTMFFRTLDQRINSALSSEAKQQSRQEELRKLYEGVLTSEKPFKEALKEIYDKEKEITKKYSQ